MLPYKIRKPVYSGASKHFLPQKPSANRNDDGDADVLEQLAREDARLIGGNLQKAILLDLIDLRDHFLERESLSSTGTDVDTVAVSSPSHAHPPVGTSFGRFKATFKDRRFGAIHTRTAPRNIDRGEYAQLLYSCCFYLLEESVAEDEVSGQENKFNLPKSIFAIFTLYTLHQTNPLPISPPTRQYTPRTKYGNLEEDALKEAWSVLPISREDQNLYRKCYKSPVRIDRKNYLLLLELSDVCKVILAHRDDSFRYCGIAQDASHIIDKMLFEDNFFSYCEYHGPCGLEGLGGNPHFYKEHFTKQKKKKKKKPKKSKSNKVETFTGQLAQDKLEKMKSDEHFNAILNVSALSDAINKHKSNIQNVTTQLQKSRQPGGDLQPRQREVVENTLSGVINCQQAYLGIAAELDGEHVLEVSKGENNNGAANVPSSKESDGNNVLPLVFPESFSSELRGNISEALADFGNEVVSIRNTVMDEIRARNTTKRKVVIDTSTAIVVGTQFEKNGQSLSDILAFFDVQSEISEDLEVNDEIDTEDEMSMATGAGKNALETLLMMAENKMNSHQLDDDSASSVDSNGAGGATIDDNSVATGSGMKALQNLLTQTTGGPAKQPANRPTKPVKRKAASSSDRAKRQKTTRVTRKASSEDDISIATGAGKNALSSLLKVAEDDIDSDQSKDGSIACTQKSVDDGNNDDSSVATGLGMKALQSLLSQTTGGSAKRPTKRKKSPTKPSQSNAAPSASKEKRQKTRRDTKQIHEIDEGEVSVHNANAAGLLGNDDISVASTTAAGKDALAALLSQVESVEEV